MTRDETIVLMTTNYFEKLDSALIRAGRMDLTINLTYCDKYQYNTIYKHIIGHEIETVCLEKIADINITPAQFIYGLLPYIESTLSDEIIIANLISALY